MSTQPQETEPLLGVVAHCTISCQPDIGRIHSISCKAGRDFEFPENQPDAYRRRVALLLAAISFTATFTCFGIAPRAGRIVREVGGHEDRLASILFVTIWELGEATGPIIIAPLSEIYGRYVAFNAANALFVTGIVLTGISPNVGSLILARFFTGSAVASNVLSPAVIKDIYPSHELGSVISAVMLTFPLGSVISPVCASALAEFGDWRYIIWMALMLAMACQVALFAFFRETYKPFILRSRVAQARPATDGQPDETSCATDNGESPRSALWLSCLRPASVLWDSTLLQALAIWGGVIYTSFYIVVTTLPGILENVYGFSSGLSGASFASLGIGSTVGILVSNFALDSIHTRLRARTEPYPEARLIQAVVAAIMIPFILTLYGFAAQLKWPVAILLFSAASFGCFFSLALASLATYTIDAFGLYSASAMACILTTRCVMGTFLPLVIVPLIRSYGYGRGLAVPAASLLGLAVIPTIVVLYGPIWRQRSRYTKTQHAI